MYSKKSQSELIENKDYNMVLLLPHNATKIIYFSKSFSIRFFLLVIKEYYVFLKVAANGSQLYAGRDFNHWTSYEELNFKYSTFLSYEARNPCSRIGDVASWPSVLRQCQVFVFLCFFSHFISFCFQSVWLVCWLF